MRTSNLNRKNLSIQIETYHRIASYGTIHDSFGDVINAVIDFGESKGMTPDTLKKFREKGSADTR